MWSQPTRAPWRDLEGLRNDIVDRPRLFQHPDGNPCAHNARLAATYPRPALDAGVGTPQVVCQPLQHLRLLGPRQIPEQLPDFFEKAHGHVAL